MTRRDADHHSRRPQFAGGGFSYRPQTAFGPETPREVRASLVGENLPVAARFQMHSVRPAASIRSADPGVARDSAPGSRRLLRRNADALSFAVQAWSQWRRLGIGVGLDEATGSTRLRPRRLREGRPTRPARGPARWFGLALTPQPPSSILVTALPMRSSPRRVPVEQRGTSGRDLAGAWSQRPRRPLRSTGPPRHCVACQLSCAPLVEVAVDRRSGHVNAW